VACFQEKESEKNMAKTITYPNNTPEEELLTVLEVATLLRVKSCTVIHWIQQGIVDAIPLPHQHHPNQRQRQSYRIRKQTFLTLLQPPIK